MKVSPDTTSFFQGLTRAQSRVAFILAILVGHGLMIYLLLDRSGILRRESPNAELWSRVYISAIFSARSTGLKARPDLWNVWQAEA